VDEVNRLSRVDKWFLRKIDHLLDTEERLIRAEEVLGNGEDLGALVADAFRLGFPSQTICELLKLDAKNTVERDGWTDGRWSKYVAAASLEVERQKVMPVFKMVDTCAGEFESNTPYYYGTFEQEDDVALANSRR
jgi:carbamoyl-phosphate synthase large subunit